MNDFINEAEVRKTIELLKPGGQLFEIRVVGRGRQPVSGYFTSADTLIKAFSTIDLRESNVYFTLNYVNAGCYSRVQRDKFRQKVSTTSDNDIDGYQWILIDFDPSRPSDTSSSKEELDKAAELAKTVYLYLQSIGFSEPVKALSGNGYHLLYRVNLQNTQENRDLVKGCLETLDTMFSTDDVHVDTTNFNPSRICKLHGTLAQKGANTPERPYRFSRIFSICQPEITDKKILQKLTEMITPEEKPAYRESVPGKRFDLIEFMTAHGMTYRDGGTARDNGQVFKLDECPFDSNHRNGDAKIILFPDGKINFFCHHNSCRGKRWQDVRLLMDPTAYDNDRTESDKRIEEGWQQHNRMKQERMTQVPASPVERFRNATQIMEDDEPDHEFIQSGIYAIDQELNGLEKQCVTVISGLRGSGKSTFVGDLILNAIEGGHTVVVYSGELANKKYLNWLTRQAAGEQYIEKSVKYKNGYGVPMVYQKQIAVWMGDKFWLYNNTAGNKFSEIAVHLENILREKQADLCIIDNLMALDLDVSGQKDKYDAQTDFVWKLKDIATRTNTHVIFVAHPKKASGLIRLDDISGAGNISNIVDNAFMVHRNNEDFKNKMADFSRALYMGLDQSASNYIEIAKDRENGTQDYFIPMFFDPVSKRMKNAPDEMIMYSWVPDQVDAATGYTITDDDVPF